jgi:heme exporter protein A
LFRDLDLEVAPGELLELTGPNGSGKSTLLRCIAGLFPDFEGEIDAAELAYLGHRPGISELLTPRQNLDWYAGLKGAPADVPGMLARVGLSGYEDVRCQRLSAGQQRRVGLARLILEDNPLWLLDEPFTALDAGGQDLVRELLRTHIAAGGGAVCATHQPLELDGTSLELGAAA